MGHESSPVFVPVASGRAPVIRPVAQLVAWLRSLLFDRLGNASRPKLLFAVATADLASAVVAWLLSCWLVSGGLAPSWPDLVPAFLVAISKVTMVHGQWSYSIPSLRQLAAPILKVWLSVGATALGAAGVIFLSDQGVASPAQILV